MGRLQIFVVFLILYCHVLTPAQVVILNGTTLTVSTGLTLTVKGDILNQNAGSVTHNGTITVTGHLTNNGSSTLITSGSGAIEMNGTASQNITGSSALNFYNLTVNNSSTGVVLGTDITVTNTLTMTDGDVQLSGKTIALGTTGSISGETNNNRIYGTTGSITATRTLNAPSSVNVAGTGLILTSAANLGSTSIVRKHNQYSIVGSSIFRNYTITPTNNTGLNATLRFSYFTNELGGLTEADLRAEESTNGGTIWTLQGGTVNTASDYLDKTGINSFALWTLSATTPLPVDFIDFKAACDNTNVHLSWATTTEMNNNYFSVEKSDDNNKYNLVGIVKSLGNSTHIQQYEFIDYHASLENTYYRIKQTDFDNTSTYSPVRSVDFSNCNDEFSFEIFPNPTSADNVHVDIKSLEFGIPISMVVYDVHGRKIHDEMIVSGTDIHNIYTIQLPHELQSGVYIIEVNNTRKKFSKEILIQ
jgi:hypothetical protein